MISVVEMIYDPDFSQDYTAYRRTGTWQAGRFIQTDNPILTMTGIILPATSEEIMQFPEGDRVTGMMKFYSDQEIFVTHTNDGKGNAGTSDEIGWRGSRYRVVNVNQYVDYGYYVAFGVQMEGVVNG